MEAGEKIQARIEEATIGSGCKLLSTTGFEPATSSVSRNATNRMLLTVQ
jgi:hypothetical protein